MSQAINVLIAVVVPVGVFAASYRSLKRNAQRLHELDDQYFVKHRLTSRTRLLILIGIGIGGWLIWRILARSLPESFSGT